MPSTLGDISKCLESTSNRAKIFRIAQYGCLLVSGSPSLDHDTQKFLLKVSSSFSDTRKALRLLDDFASLNYTLNFGLGHSVSSFLLKSLVFTVLMILFVFPSQYNLEVARNIISTYLEYQWFQKQKSRLMARASDIVYSLLNLCRKELCFYIFFNKTAFIQELFLEHVKT